MLIFLDTANLDQIRNAKKTGVLDGVTTNPTHVSKEITSIKDFHKLIKEICEIADGPVSAEVIRTDAQGMIEEARQLAKVHPHVVVKIPITPDGIQASSVLS